MSKDVLDKETEDLLSSLVDEPKAPLAVAVPKPESQVLFMPQKVAPAGGRASTRPRPPGARFNKPTKEEQEAYEAEAEERRTFIENHPVVKSAQGKDSLDLLAMVKAEVARESAALMHQRLENERLGRDISQVSSRRIDALKKIADIEMEMRKIGFDQVDVYGEKFQRIFKLWIDTIAEIAGQTLAPEQLDLFLNRLTTELEGWEDKAADLVR